MSGVFITFEGGEGCGKSTQLQHLVARLEAEGHVVRVLREPGGTATGEAVRELLLDPESLVSPVCELLLYEAARAQLVDTVIRPALERGEVVVCDRFFDSTTAYQGHGRGLPLDTIEMLNAIATSGLRPHRTIVLDLSVAEGLCRATRQGADRLESAGDDFHERVREGFLAVAAAEPERVRVVDAVGTQEQVHDRIVDALAGLGLFVSDGGGA